MSIVDRGSLIVNVCSGRHGGRPLRHWEIYSLNMSRSRSFEVPAVTNGDIIRVFLTHIRRYPWQMSIVLLTIITAESLGTSVQWFCRKFIGPRLASRVI